MSSNTINHLFIHSEFRESLGTLRGGSWKCFVVHATVATETLLPVMIFHSTSTTTIVSSDFLMPDVTLPDVEIPRLYHRDVLMYCGMYAVMLLICKQS